MSPRLDDFDLRERVFVAGLIKRDGVDGFWRRVAESCEGVEDRFWQHHELRTALWHEWHRGLSEWSATGEPDLNHVAQVLLDQWLERMPR
ncbi:MAG: hypothetical protein PVH21_15220 [Myxococcales bacterium]|jgi:hypothetical protein